MRTLPPWAIFGAVTLLGCAGSDAGRERVLLVTTTSVEASGLLDELTAAYHEHQDRYRLAPTAVGSGAALEMGRRGDADLLLTHDPDGEQRFAGEGLAVEQGPVMMNHFLIAGPTTDPADAAAAGTATEAFTRIAGAGARFISRGDDSGTHAREREIWRQLDKAPWESRPVWYTEAGTGMGETLQMASQIGAYTLADRGSFLHLRRALELEPVVMGGSELENHYTYTLPVNADNAAGARDFAAWLRGPGQEVIASYGRAEFGEPLFVPTARADAAR